MEKECEICHKVFKKNTQYSITQWNKRRFCSNACKAEWRRREFRQTDEAKEKNRLAHLGKVTMAGEKHYNWKGGITPLRKKLYFEKEYQHWRKAVFERDDHTCQECNEKGGELNADHIKPWAFFPELRYELSNGRTLCVKCHKKIGFNPWRKKDLILIGQNL